MDECVLHVVAGLGAGLEKGHTELSSKLSSLLSRDNFLVGLISLVSDENFLHLLRGVQLNLSDPVAYVREALLIGAVVSQNDAHCSFVVSLSNGPEPFLAGCVPNLQFDVLAINHYRLDLEVDAYHQ